MGAGIVLDYNVPKKCHDFFKGHFFINQLTISFNVAKLMLSDMTISNIRHIRDKTISIHFENESNRYYMATNKALLVAAFGNLVVQIIR